MAVVVVVLVLVGVVVGRWCHCSVYATVDGRVCPLLSYNLLTHYKVQFQVSITLTD